MKKILGLDLGTNSIGWALVNEAEEKKEILGLGSRIIPMDAAILGDFDKGNSISQTAERTKFRGVRRLRERYLLRRERLHRVLNIMGFLPQHYAQSIDFEKHLGQFKEELEPKLVYSLNDKTNKYEFLFKESFNEMIAVFKVKQPNIFSPRKNGSIPLIPYDWTIYYLRKKALTEKIKKEELAWLLLNFNQKRGYYQLRGEEEEENPNKLVEFHSLKVVDVTADDPIKGKTEIWYSVILENGWVYRRSSKIALNDWVGKTKEFIVTTDINDDGSIKTDKDGNEKRSFRSPSEDDWTLVKKKTETTIENSGKTVGTYIYDTLLQKPDQKINGKLVRTIERRFYKEELKLILETQKKFHPELQNENLYNACIEELYKSNETHRESIKVCDFTKLFINDIIFYQRPLKSKKSLISNCPYEIRKYKDKETGELKNSYIKCIAKSHPLFQEFRLWQFIQNLKIYEREKTVNGKLLTDVDVTSEFLQEEDAYVNLFDWLNDRKEIKQDTLLTSYFKIKKSKGADNLPYRWNYVEDKEYPCNETRAQILTRLSKAKISNDFLTEKVEHDLWHILYSVEDKHEIDKAIQSFAVKHSLNNEFVEIFRKFPPLKKEYGAYSEKAIKKLLPLMRMGKYWNETSIHNQTKERIAKIITGEYDEKIRNRVREKAINLSDINHFKGLPLWLTCYIVYDRHSEASDINKWNTPQDLEEFLEDFKQHSLRNPIVEQVITETLRVVKDIWITHGDFTEIHIELGREMKNPADKRKKISQQVTDNENTNLRIKALLMEMMNDPEISSVRPYSPSQQEILKIYEEYSLGCNERYDEQSKKFIYEETPDDILKISKQSQPTKNDLIRYKLWLDQKYRSPYTGEMIPLGKLFTSAYEIEHVIPQSRYFDDSFSNKVICEAEVNKLKDNQLGKEFINNHHGEKVELSFGKTVQILSIENYEKFVSENYSKNRGKMRMLLMEEIPEAFIERQLNDSRYISKYIKSLLSNIVREDGEQEATSKNVLSSNGGITSTLKQDWGLNDIWNTIITPRFERLNELTSSNKFGEWRNKDGKQVFQTEVPLELQKGFNKKRIDHRHHAMDALVIACATRSHINYLNNESAKANASETRHDLKNKLCFKAKTDDKGNYKWQFHKPWDSFTKDAQAALEKTIVSFKQNLRVINKTVNKYQHFENGVKVIATQTKGDNWAIRKPMHTPMPYSKKVYDFDILKIHENLGKREFIIDKDIQKEVNNIISKFNNKISEAQKYLKSNPLLINNEQVIVTAFKIKTEKYMRKQPISELSNRGQGGIKTTDDAIKFIYKVADLKIQQDLLMHLSINENDIDKAFGPDGIDRFQENRNQPIYNLPIAEKGDKRFALGKNIGNKHKWMEAAKGTNLFFAIYDDDETETRIYDTIPLNIVIENQKQGLPPVPERYFDEKNNKEYNLSFYLSPNDLVYVPTAEEQENPHLVDFMRLTPKQVKSIYKMVSSTGNQCFFIKNDIATSIVNKFEFSALNKMEKTIDGVMIKEVCWKIKVNRLGKITEANGKRI